MKGIILAGGTGSRLWPSTISVSKQLLPVYDKPLIYYPISTLMLAGIREILVITTPGDQTSFKNLLGDGHQFGLDIKYEIQEYPDGLAQAFLIGQEFIGEDSVALVLGDNIFHGSGLGRQLSDYRDAQGAVIFGFEVLDPERYGVAEVDREGKVISIEEKPEVPKSNLAIPGLYFLDNSVAQRAKSVKKSSRGELEITSVLNSYLEDGKLKLVELTRGTSWMDCGTPDSLNDASNFIRAIESRQNLKIGCIEEIAWLNKWITAQDLELLASKMGNNSYANYLKRIILR